VSVVSDWEIMKVRKIYRSRSGAGYTLTITRQKRGWCATIHQHLNWSEVLIFRRVYIEHSCARDSLPAIVEEIEAKQAVAVRPVFRPRARQCYPGSAELDTSKGPR
jgi:hypothetical protein